MIDRPFRVTLRMTFIKVSSRNTTSNSWKKDLVNLAKKKKLSSANNLSL